MASIITLDSESLIWENSDLRDLNAICLQAAIAHPSALSIYQFERIQFLLTQPQIPETVIRTRIIEERYRKSVISRANALRRFFLSVQLQEIDPLTLSNAYEDYIDLL